MDIMEGTDWPVGCILRSDYNFIDKWMCENRIPFYYAYLFMAVILVAVIISVLFFLKRRHKRS